MNDRVVDNSSGHLALLMRTFSLTRSAELTRTMERDLNELIARKNQVEIRVEQVEVEVSQCTRGENGSACCYCKTRLLCVQGELRYVNELIDAELMRQIR